MKRLSYEQFRQKINDELETRSLRDIAADCKLVHYSTLSRFASGKLELTGPKIDALAKSLGVSVIMPISVKGK